MLLDRIELFVSVAKNHNLAKTARGMHVSASSVCQRLKSLENDFGVKLYKKNKEGIELTGAGQTVFTTGSEVLNQLDTLRKTLNRNSETAAQPLTIGGTYSPSATYLPSAIASFQKMYPDIKVTFLTSDRRSVEKWVRDCEVDIAMVQSPTESSEFNMEYFAVDKLTFFAHPAHPLAKKTKLDLADLTEARLVVREGLGATHRMLKQLICRGITLNIVLRCVSPDAVKAAVRRKMGVGILFHKQLEEHLRRKELKTLKFSGLPKLVGTSYIVYSKSKPLSSAAADFLTILRSMKTPSKSSVSISEDRTDVYEAS
jgi:DNA-binding transcriptional LysR family regulator